MNQKCTLFGAKFGIFTTKIVSVLWLFKILCVSALYSFLIRYLYDLHFIAEPCNLGTQSEIIFFQRTNSFLLQDKCFSPIGKKKFSYRTNEITLQEKEGYRHRCRDLVLWISSTLAMVGGVVIADLTSNAYARKGIRKQDQS